MGEIANDMINGFGCSWCGVYFEQEHGYPVACPSCWHDAKKEAKKQNYEVKKENGEIIMINGVQPAIFKEL